MLTDNLNALPIVGVDARCQSILAQGVLLDTSLYGRGYNRTRNGPLMERGEGQMGNVGILHRVRRLAWFSGRSILIDGPIPELRVPLSLVLPTSLALAATCAFAVRLVLKAQQDRVETGIEGMSGETGTVTQALDPGR